MSKPKGNKYQIAMTGMWVATPLSLVHAEVSDFAVRLWMCLYAEVFQAGTDRVVMSHPEIAEWLGKGVSTIQRAITELVEIGALEVEKHPGSESVYTICSPSLQRETQVKSDRGLQRGRSVTGDRGARSNLTGVAGSSPLVVVRRDNTCSEVPSSRDSESLIPHRDPEQKTTINPNSVADAPSRTRTPPPVAAAPPGDPGSPTNVRTRRDPPAAKSEAEADSVENPDPQGLKPPKGMHRELVGVLASMDGCDLSRATKSEIGKITSAAKEILAADPTVTPDDVRNVHSKMMREWGGPQYVTARSIATHWSRFTPESHAGVSSCTLTPEEQAAAEAWDEYYEMGGRTTHPADLGFVLPPTRNGLRVAADGRLYDVDKMTGRRVYR